MGNVIDLQAYRSTRRPARRGGALGSAHARALAPAVFSFDVVSPWSYLAAERVERLFPGAGWEPVDGELLGLEAQDAAADRARAEARAAELRLPLVWPERPGGHSARRAAAYAAHQGRAAEFALAAGRLAYCGGFPLDDVETLAEAAAAAGLPPAPALAAAADPAWDAGLAAASGRLAARGAHALPATRVGGALMCGEDQLAAAVARAVAG